MATVQVVRQPIELPVAQLTFDSDVQCRESIQMGVVAEYKESLAAGVTFPPLVVFFDGKTNWVADGFHRGHAYRDTGVVTCPCDVRQGSKRDAILYAVGANTGHGLRRSNADKRRAVETLLKDSEWSKWTEREIANRCGVSHTTVQNIKASGNFCQIDPTEPRKAIRNGKEYEINTSNIGKTKAEKAEAPVEKLTEEPEAIELQKKDPAAFEKVCSGEIEERKAWNEVKAKEREKEGKVEEPKQETKKAPKSITEYMPVNTDTPDEIIRLTKANILEALEEAWGRCAADYHWKLIASIENLFASFKEEKCQ